MSISERHNHPGCFGVPSVFSFKSPVCDNCASRDACRESSYQALLSAKDKTFIGRFIAEHEAHRDREAKSEAHDPNFTVDVGEPRVKPSDLLTDEQKLLVESMPKKVAAYLMTLWRKGIPERVKACARRGQNPFDCGRFRPAKVAYDLLMLGGFTKQSLRVAYQESLGWTENAAFSQVSIIWRIFQALEIGKEDGERLVPHPMLGAQNVFLN